MKPTTFWRFFLFILSICRPPLLLSVLLEHPPVHPYCPSVNYGIVWNQPRERCLCYTKCNATCRFLPNECILGSIPDISIDFLIPSHPRGPSTQIVSLYYPPPVSSKPCGLIPRYYSCDLTKPSVLLYCSCRWLSSIYLHVHLVKTVKHSPLLQ